MLLRYQLLIITLNLLSLTFALRAQDFVKITDTTNPIVTTATGANYSGAAWVDYNNDGHLDLAATSRFLFKNEGGGQFSTVTTIIGANQASNLGNGFSWADFDNDGDLDCFLSGNPSTLYQNDGNDSFSIFTGGDIDPVNGNRGWACAWADYDNDGFVDLVITHPAGFIGPSTPSHFFANAGGSQFNKLSTFEFTNILAPYTVATWSDYDQDGDQDLFIASGPAGTAARDYLYQNTLVETGSAGLTRINTAPIGTDAQDGQVWNWIDYDNDGDLDAYLTNYGGALNRLYRNDDSTYQAISNNLTNFAETSLANTWGDLDNDGDEDVIITNEASFATHVFSNDGNGTFTSLSNPITTTGSTRGAVLGDYDNDGDLDLFITGPAAAKALFRNETANVNHWINIQCEGTTSNWAAIGTRVRAKATIGDIPVWQQREVSAQNSFDSHNSLRVHFGLAEATSIDSLVIEWPSGIREIFEDVAADNFYRAVEAQSFGPDPITSVDLPDDRAVPKQFALRQNYPNPFNPETTIVFDLSQNANINLSIFNITGELVRTLMKGQQLAGQQSVVWDGRNESGEIVSTGLYFYKLKSEGFVETRKMALVR